MPCNKGHTTVALLFRHFVEWRICNVVLSFDKLRQVFETCVALGFLRNLRYMISGVLGALVRSA